MQLKSDGACEIITLLLNLKSDWMMPKIPTGTTQNGYSSDGACPKRVNNWLLDRHPEPFLEL